MLHCLPCVDDDQAAQAARSALQLPRSRAVWLGQTAVEAARERAYDGADGQPVDLGAALDRALASRRSIPPDAALSASMAPAFAQTHVRVANTTTLRAARSLVRTGARALALNFANGVNPGGGFLRGALAQEETLCRSSLLHATLDGDPMYAAHRLRPLPDSTDWLILSPDVPVFRDDDGTPLARPWTLSFVTGAAPYAPSVGQARAQALMESRIRRLLAVAHAHRFHALVLGAWGCGAFQIDPSAVARHFRVALEQADGWFQDVVFAVTDWSPQRRFLGPFRDAFSAGAR